MKAFTLPDQRSENVARALVDGIIAKHRVPCILHSDQGRNFESHVVRDLCKILGIEKTRTSPYHPQYDGLVKRTNRTIIDTLSKYCSSCSTDWDMWLQLIIGAYRSAPQSSTGYSPAELVYGRPPRLPSDVHWHEPPQRTHDPQSYLEQLVAKQQLAKEIVDAEMTAAHERQTQNYNANQTEPPRFKENDLVYMSNPVIGAGQSSKIRNRFTGPYRVVEARGDDNYVIQHPQVTVGSVPRNRLKRYYPRQESNDSAEATASTTVEAQEEAEDKRQSLADNTGTRPLSDFEIEEIDCLPGTTYADHGRDDHSSRDR